MARQDEAEATIRILGEDLVTEKAKKAEKSVEKVGDKADEVAKGPLGRMKASMDALGGTMLFTEMNQGAEFASKAIELLSAGWEQLKQAASERAVSNSFSAAFGAGADAIERLQTATGGMLADNSLQQLGAQGARAGLSIEQVAKLLDSSTRAAMASGKDVAETAAVFLKSTIESNDEATKQNGVLVSLEIAQREYAKSIGTTADQLTKAQKAQISLGEITRQTDAAFKAATGDEATARLSRIEAKWQNIKAAMRDTALGVVTGDAVTGALDSITKVNDAANKVWADQVTKGDYTRANIAAIELATYRAIKTSEDYARARQLSAAIETEAARLENAALDAVFAKRAALMAQQNALAQTERERVQALTDEVRKEDDARYAAASHAQQLALMADALGSSEEAGVRWQNVLAALGTAHLNAADDVLSLYAAVKSSNNEMAKAIELEAELAAAAGDISGAEALRAQALGAVTGDGGGSKPGASAKKGGGKSKLDQSLEENAKSTAAGQVKLNEEMWSLRAAAEQNALDLHDRMRAEQDAKDMAALDELVLAYHQAQDEMIASRTAGFDALSDSVLGLRDAIGEIDGISLDGLASAAKNMGPLMDQFDALAHATDKSKGAMTAGALGITAASGRMVAGIIKDQRAQAIIMALVEQAEAWGSFARYDYVGFGAHMASSVLWGAVAGTSGGARGGAGGGGGAPGGGRAASGVSRVPNDSPPDVPQMQPVTIHINGGTYLGTDAAKTGRELARMVDMHRGRSFRGADAGSPP